MGSFLLSFGEVFLMVLLASGICSGFQYVSNKKNKKSMGLTILVIVLMVVASGVLLYLLGS